MPDTLDYEIRTQADFDRLFQSVRDDFETAVTWEGFADTEFRSLEQLHDEKFKGGGAGFFTSAGGWPPNAPSTVRMKGHSRPLFGIPSQGFRLHASLTQPNSEFGIRLTVDEWPNYAAIIFGTDAPYHAFNQYGTSRIPARPHLGISEKYFNDVAKRAVDHVFDRIQQG
jgi:hypothetical protein